MKETEKRENRNLQKRKQEKPMKWKSKIRQTFLCILISLSMVIGTVPAWVWADTAGSTEQTGQETDTPLYISDIKVATDSDSSSAGSVRAKKKLTDAGYIVLDYDLNKGTGEGWAYIGYKTTTKAEEAITDLRVMDMNGGYVMQDKESILAEYRSQETAMNRALLTAAAEFASNYKKGSPRAAEAKKVLDYIYFPEHDNMPFGEYLVRGNYQDADELKERRAEWSDIILKTSTQLTTVIYVELIQGCIDYDPDYRSKMTLTAAGMTYAAAEPAVLNPAFQEDEDVGLSGPDVSDSDGDSEAHDTDSDESGDDAADSEKNDADSSDSDVDSDGEEPGTDSDGKNERTDLSYTWLYRFSQQNSASLSEKTLDSTASSLQDAIAKEADVYQEAVDVSAGSRTDEQKLIIAAHDAMNQFHYTVKDGDTEQKIPIGDYLYGDDVTVKRLYPLAASLTAGQAAMVQIFGLKYFALNLENTAESYADETKTLETQMAQLDGSISLWYGYNEEMFADDVALTSDVMRQQAAANYNPEEYKNIYLGSWNVGNTGRAVDTLESINKYTGLAVGIIASALVITGAFALLASGTTASVLGFLGAAGAWIGTAGFWLSVCLTVIIGVVKLVELWEYYHPTYTDMPNVIYDITQTGTVSGTRAYLRYALATNPDGQQADLNVYEGKKWNAIYYSKDENAGKPITADMIVQYGSGTNGNGYSPLCLFGKEKAWNLNADTYKDDVNGIYVFFGRDGDDIIHSDLKYISALKVFSSEDERSVLKEISNSGYSYINSNLTPDSSYHTYLGYKTTSDPDYAVTDIRAGISGAYGENGTKLGDMGYTDAGTVWTENSQSIHILYTVSVPTGSGKSTVSYAGSPILSGDENFYVRYSLDEAVPDGVEPVNLLSGGPAFNLCYCYGGQPITSAAKVASYQHSQSYLYFTPEHQYKSTDDDATQYLGGLIFASTLRKFDGYQKMLKAYLKSYGYELLNDDISDSMMTSQSAIGYYVTYNPYRAVSGIATYAVQTPNVAMNAATSRTTVISRKVNSRTKKTTYTYAPINYTVVPVLEYSGNTNVAQGSSDTSGYLGANDTNAYISRFYGGDYLLGSSAALYVTSGNSSLKPIKLSEWIVTDTLNPDGIDADNGYRAVTGLLSTGNTAADLRNGSRLSTPMYMYYKGFEDRQGEYISGIELAGAAMTDDYIDTRYSSNTKDERKALKQLAAAESKSNAIQNLVSQGADDYINMYTQSDAHSQYQYLAVGASRTDTASKAITDVKLIYVSSGSPPSKVNRVIAYENGKAVTVAYSLVSYIPVYASLTKDKSNPFKQGAYYMYTSTSSLCGEKITDLSVISNAALNGEELMETFLLADNETLAGGSDQYSAETFETYRKNANKKAYSTISKYIVISRKQTDGKDASPQYITNLSAYVGYFKPSDSDKNDLAYQTTSLLNTDLNKDAKGRYIYLGYQRFAFPDTAITDIYAVISSGSQNKASIQRWIPGHYIQQGSSKEKVWIDGKNVTYYLACDGTDFNKGAGGKYIYLYYTRDTDVASPITDILIKTGKNSYDSEEGYDYVAKENGAAANMNEGAGGAKIYILMQHENGDTVNRSLMTGSMLMDGNIRNILLFAGTGVVFWIAAEVRKRRRMKQDDEKKGE